MAQKRTKKKKGFKGLKKGAFTAYCKRQGFSGVTSACIAKGKRSKNPLTRKRATLAETFRGFAKKRKKKK